MEMEHVVVHVYISNRKSVGNNLDVIATTLNQHEDVRAKLTYFAMSIIDRVIPELSRKHCTRSSCDDDIASISIACYWIVCKFNIDHFGVSYKHVQHITGICWKDFVYIEERILKIIDYDLWQFMGEEVCYEDSIASGGTPRELTSDDCSISDRSVLTIETDDILGLEIIELANRVSLE
jgi:hypothetical protein